MRNVTSLCLLTFPKTLTQARFLCIFMTVKKSIRISVSILLSAIILLSGSGLIIGKMTCLKSGHEFFSAKQAKDCCGDESTQTSLKGKCCDLKNIAFQSQNFVSQNYTHLKTNFASLVDFQFSNLKTFELQISNNKEALLFNPDPPLSRNNSNPLSLLGVFRI